MKIDDIDMLVSLLKYIDIEFMTDDEADSVCNVEINNKNEQREVIRKLIVPGVKIEYTKEQIERNKGLIKLAIKILKEQIRYLKRCHFLLKRK